MGVARRVRRDRKLVREVLILTAYVLLGILGSIVITFLSVGRLPWQTDRTDLPAWRTFDGFLTVTFGFLFTVGIAMLIANLPVAESPVRGAAPGIRATQMRVRLAISRFTT